MSEKSDWAARAEGRRTPSFVHLGGGPSAFSTWIASRIATTSSGIPPNLTAAADSGPSHFPSFSEDAHERLFSAAENCSRMSLRHLQSLRQAFGLLDTTRRASSSHAAAVAPPLPTVRHSVSVGPPTLSIPKPSQIEPTSLPSSQLPHAVPDGSDEQGWQSTTHTSTADGGKVIALQGDETRQRRLLADMFVAQWKRLREQHEQRHTELVNHADQLRQSVDERKAARARHEHDAFSNGLAFLRSSSAGGSHGKS